MGVHGNGRHFVNHTGDYVRCFPPYSRQFHQSRNVFGNHAAEFFRQHMAHAQQVFGFGPIQTAVTDFIFQLFLGQRSHLLRSIQPRKNAGCNFVDPFVRTLGRHDDGA